MEGKTGLRLANTRSGFGYMLTFERAGKKHLVIASRDTRPEMGNADLISDLNISPLRVFPTIGPVHAGFFAFKNNDKKSYKNGIKS
jgi:triacylglycerol lipase